jgi:ribonuclease P protein component
MLPKKNRISRVLFDTVLKNGIFFHSDHLIFRSVNHLQNGPSKFSFVVSKKVSKSAVKRNFLRRCGYSLLSLVLSKEKMRTSGFLGAFFFKKGSEGLETEKLREEILFLLKKARIL